MRKNLRLEATRGSVPASPGDIRAGASSSGGSTGSDERLPGLVTLFDELVRLRVGLVSVRDGLDLETPAGRLLANIMASVAAYETEVRGEQQAVGIAAARGTGKRWGGRKKGARYKVTPELAAAIRREAAAGTSKAAIARLLRISRDGVQRPQGARERRLTSMARPIRLRPRAGHPPTLAFCSPFLLPASPTGTPARTALLRSDRRPAVRRKPPPPPRSPRSLRSLVTAKVKEESCSKKQMSTTILRVGGWFPTLIWS